MNTYSEQRARERKESRAYHKWRTRVGRKLPELSQRVFALRGRMYTGCGFHYQLEHDLGRVICLCTDHSAPLMGVMGMEAVHLNRLIDRALVESLYKKLKEAERSAK